MAENVKRINAPVGRVRCRVASCKYYGQGDLCMAQNIEIKPAGASDAGEANCATFVKS